MSEVIDETKPVAQITSSEQGELRNRRNDSVYVAANRRPSVDSVPEREQAPPVRADRNLNSVDVACLIINKMIGTGIFTAPVSTLLATNSKGLVLLFWILGFIYTLISMCLYLELARELPMSGGELVIDVSVFIKREDTDSVHRSIWIACSEHPGFWPTRCIRYISSLSIRLLPTAFKPATTSYSLPM